MKTPTLVGLSALAGFVAGALALALIVTLTSVSVVTPEQTDSTATDAPMPDPGHEGDCTSP